MQTLLVLSLHPEAADQKGRLSLKTWDQVLVRKSSNNIKLHCQTLPPSNNRHHLDRGMRVEFDNKSTKSLIALQEPGLLRTFDLLHQSREMQVEREC
jgi:hypothetical protein